MHGARADVSHDGRPRRGDLALNVKVPVQTSARLDPADIPISDPVREKPTLCQCHCRGLRPNKDWPHSCRCRRAAWLILSDDWNGKSAAVFRPTHREAATTSKIPKPPLRQSFLLEGIPGETHARSKFWSWDIRDKLLTGTGPHGLLRPGATPGVAQFVRVVISWISVVGVFGQRRDFIAKARFTVRCGRSRQSS